MNTQEIFLYVLDIIIIVMFARMLKNSKEVELEVIVSAKAKLLIIAIFGLLIVAGLIRYEGNFKYIQTILLVIITFMYYNMKSGLSAKGIVMMGSLTTYEKASPISVSKENSCVTFKQKKLDAALFFDPDQYEEIREYLRKQKIINN